MDLAHDTKVRENLEHLFQTFSGIDDPVMKLQFKQHAFEEAQRITGYNLIDLVRISEEKKAAARETRRRKELETFLNNLQNSLLEGTGADAILNQLRDYGLNLDKVQKHSALDFGERLSGQVGRYKAYLAERTGRKFAGAEQSVLPTLNAALNGFQGLSLFAGPTNTSKTQLMCHFVPSFIARNPEYSILYLMLDQEEHKVLSRICACVSGYRIDKFEQGSSSEGLTEDDRVARELADVWLRENLGNRLVVLDRSYFPDLRAGINQIEATVEYVRKLTGCKRVLTILDYLDLATVPEQERLRELVIDDNRMQALLDWRLLHPNDPIIAITEFNKETVQSGEYSAVGIKGSARKMYSPDNTLILAPLSDAELVEWIDDNEGWGYQYNNCFLRREPLELSEKDAKSKDTKKYGKKRRDWLADYHSVGLGTIKVDKVRDGGRKCKIYYTSFFRESRFMEGLHIPQRSA